MIGFGEGQMKGHLGTHVCLVTQPCPTLCDPMGYSTPGSSVHGISKTRILEWVAISFSRRCSKIRDQTSVSCIDWSKEYGCPVFPPWLLVSSHVVIVSRSPWHHGKLYKPLCYGTLLGHLHTSGP